MKRKKIYISLPISGQEERARERADLLKAKLSRSGWEVVNPFEIFPPTKDPDYIDFLFEDIKQMLRCDVVFLANGWESSFGCQTEYMTAQRFNVYRHANIQFIFENDETFEEQCS